MQSPQVSPRTGGKVDFEKGQEAVHRGKTPRPQVMLSAGTFKRKEALPCLTPPTEAASSGIRDNVKVKAVTLLEEKPGGRLQPWLGSDFLEVIPRG